MYRVRKKKGGRERERGTYEQRKRETARQISGQLCPGDRETEKERETDTQIRRER